MILDKFEFYPDPKASVEEKIEELEENGFRRLYGSMEDVKRVDPSLYRKFINNPDDKQIAFTKYRDCVWYKPWSTGAKLYAVFIYLLLSIPIIFPLSMFIVGYLNPSTVFPDAVFYMIGAFTTPLAVIAGTVIYLISDGLKRFDIYVMEEISPAAESLKSW